MGWAAARGEAPARKISIGNKEFEKDFTSYAWSGGDTNHHDIQMIPLEFFPEMIGGLLVRYHLHPSKEAAGI